MSESIQEQVNALWAERIDRYKGYSAAQMADYAIYYFVRGEVGGDENIYYATMANVAANIAIVKALQEGR